MSRAPSIALLFALSAALAASGQAAAPRLRFTEVDHEPAGGQVAPTDAELTALRAAVAAAPGDRAARFALVKGLERAGKLDDAVAAAREWRAADAYNLVVVRMLGDLYTQLGRKEEARRTYSAVVELLPDDAGAQRALASVLKQNGDVEGAYARLTAAVKLSPDDRRLGFELADAAHRLGRAAEARERFEAIAGDPEVPEAVQYPAKQRLAQLYQEARRAALALGKAAAAEALGTQLAALGLKGGSENDLKIYLTWDTDRSDVDLWVTNPAGEKVFYEHKVGQFGEALFDDVTTGYGPESFTAEQAHPGTYTVEVNYYGAGRSNFSEARGEVVVVLGEGTAHEEKHVVPYRLFEEKQTVTVARIEVQ